MGKNRSRDISKFLIGVGVIIVLNVIGSYYFLRIDLTEDKRYSMSSATIEMLKNLEGEVVVEVYLEGDLPSGFKRLQKAVREQLEGFRMYGGNNIHYKFFDPSTISDPKKRNQFYIDLGKKGIQVTNVFAEEDGKKIEKLILPGAVVTYGNKEQAVMLLRGNRASSSQEILNQSVENVEFELATAIETLTKTKKKKIAIITGHQELEDIAIGSFTNELAGKYDLYKVNLPERKNLLGYDAIIVNQPKEKVSEEDKYKIDQFIMDGGRALFFIDEIRISMDSIGAQGTYAFTYNHNLGDLFFKYGVRINANLVQDLSSGQYPMVVGNFGDKPQIQLMPWPFFPLINNLGNSPIVKNMDMALMRFVSSVDTVKANGIRKTSLLSTSLYSRILNTPVRVNFNDLRREMNPNFFNQGPIPVAYLLEGKFSSIYKNRILPSFVEKGKHKPEGISTKVLVCADGDFLRNEINFKTGEPYPLGYDPFAQTNYSNKIFIENALEYMLNEKGLISAKRKEIVLRPLDKIKVQNEKTKWQLINLILPVLIVVIFGIIRQYLRKRKYQSF